MERPQPTCRRCRESSRSALNPIPLYVPPGYVEWIWVCWECQDEMARNLPYPHVFTREDFDLDTPRQRKVGRPTRREQVPNFDRLFKEVYRKREPEFQDLLEALSPVMGWRVGDDETLTEWMKEFHITIPLYG